MRASASTQPRSLGSSSAVSEQSLDELAEWWSLEGPPSLRGLTLNFRYHLGHHPDGPPYEGWELDEAWAREQQPAFMQRWFEYAIAFPKQVETMGVLVREYWRRFLGSDFPDEITLAARTSQPGASPVGNDIMYLIQRHPALRQYTPKEGTTWAQALVLAIEAHPLLAGALHFEPEPLRRWINQAVSESVRAFRAPASLIARGAETAVSLSQWEVNRRVGALLGQTLWNGDFELRSNPNPYTVLLDLFDRCIPFNGVFIEYREPTELILIWDDHRVNLPTTDRTDTKVTP